MAPFRCYYGELFWCGANHNYVSNGIFRLSSGSQSWCFADHHINCYPGTLCILVHSVRIYSSVAVVAVVALVAPLTRLNRVIEESTHGGRFNSHYWESECPPNRFTSNIALLIHTLHSTRRLMVVIWRGVTATATAGWTVYTTRTSLILSTPRLMCSTRRHAAVLMGPTDTRAHPSIQQRPRRRSHRPRSQTLNSRFHIYQ